MNIFLSIAKPTLSRFGSVFIGGKIWAKMPKSLRKNLFERVMSVLRDHDRDDFDQRIEEVRDERHGEVLWYS